MRLLVFLSTLLYGAGKKCSLPKSFQILFLQVTKMITEYKTITEGRCYILDAMLDKEYLGRGGGGELIQSLVSCVKKVLPNLGKVLPIQNYAKTLYWAHHI
jgi:hypothetical protein